MKNSKVKMSKMMLDELSTSTPTPDSELTTKGLDLYWYPPDFIKRKETKKETEDIIGSLL